MSGIVQVQQIAGSPEQQMRVTIPADQEARKLSSLGFMVSKGNSNNIYANIHVVSGMLGYSLDKTIEQGEGMWVGTNNAIVLEGTEEINKFYFRAFTAIACVIEVLIERS